MDAQWDPSRIAAPTRCEATRRAPIEVVIAPVDPEVSLPFHLCHGAARRLEAGTLTPREYFNLTSLRSPWDMEFEDRYGRDGDAWNITLRTLVGRFDRFPTIRQLQGSLPGLIELAVCWDVSSDADYPEQSNLLEAISAFSPRLVMDAFDAHAPRCRSLGAHSALLELASLVADPDWCAWTESLLSNVLGAWESPSIARLAVRSLGPREAQARLMRILKTLSDEDFLREGWVLDEVASALPHEEGRTFALNYAQRVLRAPNPSPDYRGPRATDRCLHLLYPFRGPEVLAFVERVFHEWVSAIGTHLAADGLADMKGGTLECIVLASLAAVCGIPWSTFQQWRLGANPSRLLAACVIFVICHPGEPFLHDPIIRDQPTLRDSPSLNELIRFIRAWESQEPDEAIRAILRRAIARVEN